jgi:hypothetical protein
MGSRRLRRKGMERTSEGTDGEKDGEKGTSRPVSRVLSGSLRLRDGHSSGTPVARRLVQSTRAGSVRTRLASAVSRSARPPLFDLAPGGVCPAISVTRDAVRSYRTISPLPSGLTKKAARLAVCFLWHFPWGRPRRPLAATVFSGSPDFPPPDACSRAFRARFATTKPGSGRPAGWLLR